MGRGWRGYYRNWYLTVLGLVTQSFFLDSWYGNKGTRYVCSMHQPFETVSRLIITKRPIDQVMRGLDLLWKTVGFESLWCSYFYFEMVSITPCSNHRSTNWVCAFQWLSYRLFTFPIRRNKLCISFSISAAGRSQIWKSKEIGEKQKQKQRKQSKPVEERRKEKWEEISVAITFENKEGCRLVKPWRNGKWLLHCSQCSAIFGIQRFWMGYWSKREEEEKGQGEKEKMTFPGISNKSSTQTRRSGQTRRCEFIIAATLITFITNGVDLRDAARYHACV